MGLGHWNRCLGMNWMVYCRSNFGDVVQKHWIVYVGLCLEVASVSLLLVFYSKDMDMSQKLKKSTVVLDKSNYENNIFRMIMMENFLTCWTKVSIFIPAISCFVCSSSIFLRSNALTAWNRFL